MNELGRNNPYRHTAFAVLGIDPSLGRREITTHVKRCIQRVRFGIQTLFGRPVSEAEVYDAEQRLKDPSRRLVEELRAHRPHPAQVQVDDLAARLAQLRVPAPSGDAPRIVLDRTLLTSVVSPLYPRTFPPLTADG